MKNKLNPKAAISQKIKSHAGISKIGTGPGVTTRLSLLRRTYDIDMKVENVVRHFVTVMHDRANEATIDQLVANELVHLHDIGLI